MQRGPVGAFEQSRIASARAATHVEDHRATAMLVLARRRLAAGLAEDAEVAAATAESLLVGRRREADLARARRLRGAALLRARRFEEAFDVLSGVMDAETFDGCALPITQGCRAVPLELALHAVAESALWASSRSVDWICALGTLVERLETSGAARCEEAVVRARFEHDLSVIARDADVARAERELAEIRARARSLGSAETARAAEAARPLRGIDRRGFGGDPIVLRIAIEPGRWLRVHAGGWIERSTGDARSEDLRVELGSIAHDGDLLARAIEARDVVVAGAADVLDVASDARHAYFVQAFDPASGAFAEGWIDASDRRGTLGAPLVRAELALSRTIVGTVRRLLERAAPERRTARAPRALAG